jgi:hypothetical protein
VCRVLASTSSGMKSGLLNLETHRKNSQINGYIRASVEEDRAPNAVTFLHGGSPRECQQHHHNQKQSLVPGIGYAKMLSRKHYHDQAVREVFPIEWFEFAQE